MKRLILMVCLGLMLPLTALAGDLSRTQPHPSLTPRDVVTIVMRALQHNDTPYAEHGLEVTFNFASPANKSQTGPLPRFKMMVRNRAYAPMINHRRISFEKVDVQGDTAQIDIVLSTPDQKHLGYRFLLSRQKDNAYAGSWMTNSVMPYKVLAL